MQKKLLISILQSINTNSWPRSFSTPLNSYKCRFGGSHSTVPLKFNRSLVSSSEAVAGAACLIFKFVSPSKFDVSIKAMLCGSLDDTRTMSAGKNALFIIRTISPTTRFCHLMATHCPLRKVSTSRWLMSSSARCRFCNRSKDFFYSCVPQFKYLGNSFVFIIYLQNLQQSLWWRLQLKWKLMELMWCTGPLEKHQVSAEVRQWKEKNNSNTFGIVQTKMMVEN